MTWWMSERFGDDAPSFPYGRAWGWTPGLHHAQGQSAKACHGARLDGRLSPHRPGPDHKPAASIMIEGNAESGADRGDHQGDGLLHPEGNTAVNIAKQ